MDNRDIKGLGFRINYPFKDNPTNDDSINELRLHSRTLGLLRKNGVRTIGQLREQSNWDIEDMQNMSSVTLASINEALRLSGFPPLREEKPQVWDFHPDKGWYRVG